VSPTGPTLPRRWRGTCKRTRRGDGRTRSHPGSLGDERARSQGALTRAEAAEQRTAVASEKLEAAREEFANTVSAHQSALESARADVERRRTAFDQRIAELQAGHEQTVRSMHETTTTLGADLRTHTVRAEQAEHSLARVLAAVAVLRDSTEVVLPAEVVALLPPVQAVK